MTIKKPKLSLDEQIEHLKDKGILFNIMDESDAKKYLEQNNNYFKLTACRKNYNKHPDGKNKGKYINLEFAYLVDMAIIDMRLRYQIVHMALDIEHHAKLQLLRKLDEYDEDGYQIVQDYINSLTERQKKIYDGEIERCRRSIYCSGIIEKYDGGPVGIDTIAAAISEERDTIEDVYEPYLLKNGFLNRTARGRVATQTAYEHLGIAFPE